MSKSNSACSVQVDNLERLLKAVKNNEVKAKIGILGPGATRKKSDGQTNADIGMAHEFGTSKIAQRSFLRVPLAENLNKALEKSGAFDKEVLKKVIKEKDIKPWLEKVAAVALAVVLEGFHNGGYGKWPAWKNPKYKNNTGMILVDTTQLRDSITTEVK
jgi:hypothetical protein